MIIYRHIYATFQATYFENLTTHFPITNLGFIQLFIQEPQS